MFKCNTLWKWDKMWRKSMKTVYNACSKQKMIYMMLLYNPAGNSPQKPCKTKRMSASTSVILVEPQQEFLHSESTYLTLENKFWDCTSNLIYIHSSVTKHLYKTPDSWYLHVYQKCTVRLVVRWQLSEYNVKLRKSVSADNWWLKTDLLTLYARGHPCRCPAGIS